jgi:hypothetical protein
MRWLLRGVTITAVVFLGVACSGSGSGSSGDLAACNAMFPDAGDPATVKALAANVKDPDIRAFAEKGGMRGEGVHADAMLAVVHKCEQLRGVSSK